MIASILKTEWQTISRIIGAFGFLHELLIQNAERPFLLTASCALMGLPLVFKGEEKLKQTGVLPHGGEEKEDTK